jgi:hypothetical protein
MWGLRDLIIRAALERRIERLEREKVAHIRTFKQINDQAHRATLVQDRSAHIIKQTCAIIAEEAAEWIDAV